MWVAKDGACYPLEVVQDPDRSKFLTRVLLFKEEEYSESWPPRQSWPGLWKIVS